MKRLAWGVRLCFLGIFILVLSTPAASGENLVKLERAGERFRLSWPGAISTGQGGMLRPEFQVQESADLHTWRSLGGKVRAFDGLGRTDLSLDLPASAGARFYRVQVDTGAANPHRMGDGGAEVFGFNGDFQRELARIGFISVEQFTNSFPQPAYLPSITFDPESARFWTNFAGRLGFQLNDGERSVLRTNGFVVSERLASSAFGDMYYRIFTNDLPVFVTSDSILQAWHRSYVNMLEEVEEGILASMLERMLTGMAGALPQAASLYGKGPLSNSIVDADYWLTVANSLWVGQQKSTILKDSGTEENVGRTLLAIANERSVDSVIFGAERRVDYSQFKLRGHYMNSARLSRYFKAMMWCGRLDLRIASYPVERQDLRELGTAIVLEHLLRTSGQFTNWQVIEKLTSLFVGTTDSMTFPQLRQLLLSAGINSPGDISSAEQLAELRDKILSGDLGAQSIISDWFWSPRSPEQVKLPRSFTVCGQKFVLDSWAFSQVVFDRVLWPTNDGPEVLFTKVLRRKPISLDAAFAVFGNDATVPEIAARILDDDGVIFRDGFFYQHNLSAARAVIDSQNPDAWESNIYNGWLGALRALSRPTTDPKHPEAMRTRAWAMKSLNTQLASWTHLRHDTVLYAKQSYTPPFACEYPAGFVEPVPEFWAAMERLARLTADAMASVRVTGSVAVPPRSEDPLQFPTQIAFEGTKSRIIGFTKNFAERMATLRGIAEKELASQPLSTNETAFLESVVENRWLYIGAKLYTGWYPKLFFQNVFAGFDFDETQGCDRPDALVADVHTDLPDPTVGDPGAVIHQGVGDVNLLIIAVDNGPDRAVYAGPVLSHYEFEQPSDQRLSDEDWRALRRPPSPSWTRSYLVPGR